MEMSKYMIVKKCFKSSKMKNLIKSEIKSLENNFSANPLKIQMKDIAAGDVFIHGGFPGHAVLVLDVVENETGEKKFLLGQSYMPAQDFHVLKNPNSQNPWYSNQMEGPLETPEWTFELDDLKRFN